jgi:hypothetical protein
MPDPGTPSVPAPAIAVDPSIPVTNGDQGSNKSSNPVTQSSSSSGSSGGISSGAKAGIGVVAAILVLSLVGAALWYKKKRRRVHGYHAGFVMPSPASSTTQVLGNFYQVHLQQLYNLKD